MKISDQNKTFFMGNSLFGKQEMTIEEKIAQKKQMRYKEAMHIVTTARAGEKKLDDSVLQVRERVQALHKENEEANQFVNELKGYMAEAKEACQITDDCQEQKDLELLQKAYEAKKVNSHVELTDEEKERLARMGEMTEYQKQSMELYAQMDDWKEKIAENQRLMAQNTAVLKDIKLERLKSQGMLEAQRAKEEIMEAASKEAIGMLREDVKNQIDEKTEEIREEAKEREEKEKLQEERIEAAKEHKAENQAAVERNRENVENLTKQAVESEDIIRDVESEIEKILDEEKLLLEDLKGLAVDTGI